MAYQMLEMQMLKQVTETEILQQSIEMEVRQTKISSWTIMTLKKKQVRKLKRLEKLKHRIRLQK